VWSVPSQRGSRTRLLRPTDGSLERRLYAVRRMDGSETVRKAPLGLGLKPQKATKRAQKALFAALGAKNGRLQRLF
jgi:hypothetical protein